jgi:hypothetical protein
MRFAAKMVFQQLTVSRMYFFSIAPTLQSGLTQKKVPKNAFPGVRCLSGNALHLWEGDRFDDLFAYASSFLTVPACHSVLLFPSKRRRSGYEPGSSALLMC